VLRLQTHAANRAIARVILLDLRMHWAGVDHLVGAAENSVALERHAAFRTTSGRVALRAIAHWIKVDHALGRGKCEATPLYRCALDQRATIRLQTTGRPRRPMTSFFAELQRRNVYKVAAAYAVVGWLVVQIATQVFPFFEIPN